MTDSNLNPKLAALRGLEESLLSHRRAQAAKAHADSSVDSTAPDPAAARRVARLMGGRRIRYALTALGTLVVVVGVAFGALWYRLSSGPIALDFATDWLAAAIKENLGSRYDVQVGGTVLERDENGRTALRIRDIVVRDSDGAVVANAPRAEVGLASLSLLSGHPRAESLNLVGAALSLRVEHNGDVSIFTGADRRPLAHAPMLASAEPMAIPTRALTAQAAPIEAAPSQPSARGSFRNLGAL